MPSGEYRQQALGAHSHGKIFQVIICVGKGELLWGLARNTDKNRLQGKSDSSDRQGWDFTDDLWPMVCVLH